MALIDSVIVFLTSLLIGALGIYLGSRAITGESDFGYSVLTALIGALVWGIVNFFFGVIPLIGGLIAMISWIWVINSRYRGGWINAVLIGFLSWLSVVIILFILSSLGLGTPEALGIPNI